MLNCFKVALSNRTEGASPICFLTLTSLYYTSSFLILLLDEQDSDKRPKAKHKKLKKRVGGRGILSGN